MRVSLLVNGISSTAGADGWATPPWSAHGRGDQEISPKPSMRMIG
jgi:hypothetical protein